MKKVFALLLVSVFAFGMVGCGDDDAANPCQGCADTYCSCVTACGDAADLTCLTNCGTTAAQCLVDNSCTTSDAGAEFTCE